LIIFRLAASPLTCHELLDGIMNGPSAKVKLDEKTIAAFNSFIMRLDLYGRDRREELEREQEKASKAKSKK
jgi:hypothetical protein